MDVVPADDHRYKFADNKWYVDSCTKKSEPFLAETNFHFYAHNSITRFIVLRVAASLSGVYSSGKFYMHALMDEKRKCTYSFRVNYELCASPRNVVRSVSAAADFSVLIECLMTFPTAIPTCLWNATRVSFSEA